MCGIAGKLYRDPEAHVERDLLERMSSVMAYRGPGDEGFYAHRGVGMVHRRLSIIGLEDGHQPLSNEDGSVWVVFNGEIYNYQALKRELLGRGHVFRTGSDTEVLVHLYEEHGARLVERLHGMFAFALHDRSRDLLLLARDRVGIKPLYYAETPDGLVFGSEIKSLVEDPGVDRSVDPRAIDRVFTFLYSAGPETLMRGVRKLPPAHVLVAQRGKTSLSRYWDLGFQPERPAPSFEDSVARLDDLLREVVTEHMTSDVPVGCLLSGGLDSTAVLSMASQSSPYPIETFTIGFEGGEVTDERRYARIAARAHGSRHHETTISPRAFADFLPRYVWHMEEPTCEPPAIALYYVAKLAREHVKVVLSGEGGDEAFAGYSNYRILGWVERAKRALGPLRPALLPMLSLAGRLHRRAGELSLALREDAASYYTSRTCMAARRFDGVLEGLYSDELRAGVDRGWSRAPAQRAWASQQPASMLNSMLYVDTVTWLPDDLLVKADKITMANSLELRVPLLDHRVLEFAAGLPESFKLRGSTGKRVLKSCFARRLPREILERPKAGFPVPYEHWFQTLLKDDLRELLLDPRAVGRGYFRRDAMERLLEESARSGAHAKQLFCLAALEHWHRLFVDRSA